MPSRSRPDDGPTKRFGVRRPIVLPTPDIEAAQGLAPARPPESTRDPVEPAPRPQATESVGASATGSASRGADEPQPRERQEDDSPAAATESEDSASANAIAQAVPPHDNAGPDDDAPPDRPKKPILATAAIGGAVLISIPFLVIGMKSHDDKPHRNVVAAESVLGGNAGQPPGAFGTVSPTASPPKNSKNPKTLKASAKPLPAKPRGTDPRAGSYSFDEGHGTVAKDSIGKHSATLVGAAQWTRGHSGSAVWLNRKIACAARGGGGKESSDDCTSPGYVDTGAAILNTAGSYSVAAWVRLNSLSAFATAVSQDGPNRSAFFLQYDHRDKRFAFSAGARVLSRTEPKTGLWYHLVGVRDVASSSVTLYVNGMKRNSARLLVNNPSAGHTMIGRAQYGGKAVDFWPGTIDQVRLWNRALAAKEVTRLYRSGG